MQAVREAPASAGTRVEIPSAPAALGARPSVLTAVWIVVGLGVVPYLNTLGAGFTFDDFGLVVGNPAVPAGAPFWRVFVVENVPGGGGAYRPLTILTYLANAALGGGPPAYHAVNVLLHAAVSVLALFLALRLFAGARWGALAAAAVFAVHPVHTEAVASVVGRAEVLAALGVLAAILASLRGASAPAGQGGRWTALALGCFTVGLLAKESAITGLLLLPLAWRWLVPATPPGRLARRLAPYAAVALAFVAVRALVVGSLTTGAPPTFLDNPLHSAGVSERLGTAVVILFQYLSVLAVPWRLSADESYAQVPVVTSVTDPRLLLAAGVLGGLALTLIAVRRRTPAVVFAALFGALALAVTANVLFPTGVVKAERLLYLPSVGWCLFVGWVALRWTGGEDRTRAAVVALVVLVLAGRTWARNRDWHDNATLFAATVAASPNSARAHANLAATLAQAGRRDEARVHYERALEIFPFYAHAAAALGRVHELEGETEAAAFWYAKALAVEPGLAGTRLRLALVTLRRGDAPGAEREAHAGLARAPGSARLLLALALARAAQGDADEAARLLARAEPAAGRDPEARGLLDETRRALGR